MKSLFQFFTAAVFAIASIFAHSQPAAPNDAQIAGIVVAANSVDIEAGKLAETRSGNNQIKDFAKRMVVDHTGVNEQASALVRKLNVTPEESETSKGLKESGAKNLEKLKALNGTAFDKAYLDNEVAYHQTVIDALDTTLVPSAKNEELKALLIKVRPAFVAHRDHASQLHLSLK